jgi:hypothetical protein
VEAGLHPCRDADHRVVGQGISSAEQRSGLENLSDSHLASSPASTDQRDDRVGRRTEMEIQARQNPSVFDDRPPSPTRGSEAMQEWVQMDPPQGFEPSRLWPGQQMQVDVPRPSRPQRRGANTAREQKIGERVRSESGGTFVSAYLLGLWYAVHGSK